MLDLSDAPQIVFVMGLPAAGKSTWISHNLSDYGWIDPDRIKLLHPYYDPHMPHLVHGWSKAFALHLFDNLMKRCRGRWVIEGTGANADEMVYNLKIAHAAGYITNLVYIKCDLDRVIMRNNLRPRVIPLDIIVDKASKIDNSFAIASLYAHAVMEVDNNIDYEAALQLSLPQQQVYAVGAEQHMQSLNYANVEHM